jgi:hypothetical protein
MSAETFATAHASSVGGHGAAQLLATALLAHMDKDVGYFHGETLAALDSGLGVKVALEQASQVGGASKFDYQAVESGPDGIAHGGVANASVQQLLG